MRIIPNSDAVTYELCTEEVEANNGYCPCKLKKIPDNKCICREFQEQQEEGECYCGRYVKMKK